MGDMTDRRGTLYTLSYAERYAQSTLEGMLRHGNRMLVDIRLVPCCSGSDYWTRKNLFHEWPMYVYQGHTLGNRNHTQANAPIELVNPEKGIAWAANYLQEGIDLLLLCGCQHYATCHRRTVYEAIQQRLGRSYQCPAWLLNQRVNTPKGAGRIDDLVPMEIQWQRNRIGVMLETWHSGTGRLQFFYSHELEAWTPVQGSLLPNTQSVKSYADA